LLKVGDQHSLDIRKPADDKHRAKGRTDVEVLLQYTQPSLSQPMACLTLPCVPDPSGEETKGGRDWNRVICCTSPLYQTEVMIEICLPGTMGGGGGGGGGGLAGGGGGGDLGGGGGGDCLGGGGGDLGGGGGLAAYAVRIVLI